jgi:hypothetical protein
MNVKVMLKYGLDKVLEKDVVECDINSGGKVVDLLKQINFPADKAVIILVDGKKKCMDSILYGGEIIKVYPENFNTMAV